MILLIFGIEEITQMNICSKTDIDSQVPEANLKLSKGREKGRRDKIRGTGLTYKNYYVKSSQQQDIL